jgi:hypothetical protein
MQLKNDLIGCKFGKLTVIKDTGKKNKKGSVIWLCKCECGNETESISYRLKSGNTKTCGHCRSNRYNQNKDGYVECITKKGEVIKVDKEDVEILKPHNWAIVNNGYAITYIKRKLLPMQNFIMNPPKGFVVDHINRDKLDNRKSNLRIATLQQNSMNRRKHNPNSLSKYKGVAKDKNKWVAQIIKDGKRKEIGRYETQEEAAIAYNQSAIEVFGEFAWLNEV